VEFFESTSLKLILGAIVLLPLLGFALNGLVAFKAPEKKGLPTLIGPAVVIVSFLLALTVFSRMLGVELLDPVIVNYWSWIPVGRLQVDAAFQLDQLSILMTLIITGVGSLIHLFSIGYMKDDPGYARYFAYLNFFVFFMLILVLGANLPMMFVGWEGVGLCSYLLIGFWFRDREKADAGKKAFIVNRVGDFGFLVAMMLLFANLGTLNFTEIMEAAPAAFTYGGALVTAITLFLFLGATGKSAQIPLFVWLPDAMAGPTPVSALIHAATMVTAGVYLIARAGVLFALAPLSLVVVAGVGVLTALFAATIGLAQYDIKRVLAYSTVSQLGYMFLGVGVGAFSAGFFHLMTHAFFKALLFLGSGAVIFAVQRAFTQTGKEWDPQDMRNMGGLRKFMPITWITMWIATLAISGVWPFAGFFSKDEIIWLTAASAVGPYAGWYKLFWVMAVIAAMMTAFYMTRLMIMTFHGPNRSGDAESRHIEEVPGIMWIPLAVLAVLSVVGGWINVPAAIKELPLFGWIPSSEWLHHWLEPVTSAADGILLSGRGALAETAPIGGGAGAWAVISCLIAIGVILLATRLIGARSYSPAHEAAEPTGLTRVLNRKWYVDELYDAIIVRPILATSRALWRVIDQGIIDGVVNGVGNLSRMIGWAGAKLQTGQLNTYAFAVVVGVLILLGYIVF